MEFTILTTLQECRHCRRQLAPLDPKHTVPPHALRDLQPPFLGDAIVSPDAGIWVDMKRIEELSVMVMLYKLPDGYLDVAAVQY